MPRKTLRLSLEARRHAVRQHRVLRRRRHERRERAELVEQRPDAELEQEERLTDRALRARACAPATRRRSVPTSIVRSTIERRAARTDDGARPPR